MTRWLVFLCSYADQHDYSDYIELVTEHADLTDQYTFVVQSDASVYRQLHGQWPTHQFEFVGIQRKSHAECIINALINWGNFDRIRDPFEDLECESCEFLDYRLPCEIIDEIQSLMERYSISAVVDDLLSDIRAKLSELKSVARDSSLLIGDWIDQVAIICDIERKLFDGIAECTLGQLASSTIYSLPSHNKIHALTENVRHFRNWKCVDMEGIDSRLELCIALGSQLRTAPTSYLIDYYLVFSAFLFSNSKYYLSVNSNLSSLYLFRSFELSIICLALERQVIKVAVVDRELVFQWVDPPPKEHKGGAVNGVGKIWYRLRDRNDVPSLSFATSLSSLVSGRNKSIIGHGLLYFSGVAIEKAQADFVEMIKACFNSNFQSKWMHYKRVSRPLKLSSLIGQPFM